MVARVTVMIPSYNYAQYLTACVESAAAQPEADVVIVDNGSTDDSPALGAALAERHKNVRFVRHDTNDGIITSFERCRAEVRADYAMLLCADDLLAPGALARAVPVLDAHPRVGLMYGTAISFSDESSLDLSALPTAQGEPVVHEGDRWVDRLCRRGHNPILTPEAVWRSTVYADAGPYAQDCRYTSDLNLWLRLAARSDVLYLPGPVQAMFRMHDVNAGKDFPTNSRPELEQRWLAYERFFETLQPGDPRHERWEAAARRMLAGDARYSASRAYVSGAPDDVDDLLDLAEQLDPTPASERMGWAVRRRLGPTAASRFPGFMVRPVARRAAKHRADRRRDEVGLG